MTAESGGESEEYVCEYCGKKFKTLQALASHKKYKHGYNPRKSPIEHDKPLETGIAGDSESEVAEYLTLPEDDFTSAKRIGMKVDIEPEILILYTYALNKGFRGSFGDFINACVINYMDKRAGVKVALIESGEILEKEVDEEWLS